jgi:hypothetical protein
MVSSTGPRGQVCVCHRPGGPDRWPKTSDPIRSYSRIAEVGLGEEDLDLTAPNCRQESISALFRPLARALWVT